MKLKSFFLSSPGFSLSALAGAFAFLLASAGAALPGAPQRTSRERSIPDIVKSTSSAVVLIVTFNASGESVAQGSGFLVSADGKVATNYHVIQGADSAIVKMSDGGYFPVVGVSASSKEHDLALLKVSAKGLPYLRLADAKNVVVGDKVIAMGSPLGLEGTVSDGIVSAIRGDDPSTAVIQTTAPASEGNSGGPLLNLEGSVVGVLTLKLEGGENLNFAVPVGALKSLMASARAPVPLSGTNEPASAAAPAPPPSTARAVAPKSNAGSATPPSTFPETTAPAQSQASLLSAADSVLEEVSQITGWPIRSQLKKQVVSRAEVQKYLIENLREEYTPKELHVQEATLKAFGLVAPDFDLGKFLITFYTEQAAGFYDPRRKTMCIADWVSADMQGIVLAHELTHALQDQNFDLDKFVHADRGNDDATNARQAVVEGYATAVMMQRMLGGVDLAAMPSLAPLLESVVHQQMGEFPAFSSAPSFFRFQALFPYTEGMGFMQAGLKQGGWKALKQVFVNPPTTTKEIFEPQLYFEHKPLPAIALPSPEALANVPHLEKLDENTMGQMGYYSLLGQFLSEDETKSVSRGWLADRYILYEDAGAHHYALVGRTRWSSPETASSFCTDYHTILSRKYPELTAEKQSTTDLFTGSAANGRVVLLHKGGECLWAEGVPPAQTDKVLNYLSSL